MKSVSFVLCIHNHQPIGNFDGVFEEAYQKSYLPFVEVFERHPSVKWNLHCTGILWEWIEGRHPEYLEKVRTMVKRGQLELMSGGYYEPILSVIPDEDKVGQIRKLSDYLSDRFGVQASGMWCAERVWEPQLPRFLKRAGIGYTVLDDIHFLAAGLSDQDLFGYYKVEDQNDAVDVFPGSRDARFTIPFRPHQETFDLLRRAADSGPGGRQPLVAMADDGEKFGLWPDTYKHCYEDGWLDKFLTMLEKNASWIKSQTFAEYRAANRPLGKVYLPTSSYFEMSKWALPTPSAVDFDDMLGELDRRPDGGAGYKRFLKGGIWRNFIAKYPEANSMYKKMLWVSGKVHRAEEAPKKKAKPAAPVREALDRLWAGQCNCSYWHGVFGGLYLPILRNAIYQNLIEAEKALDRAANGHQQALKVSVTDYDSDGQDEVIVETASQNLYLAPAQGGMLFEWDFKPAALNIGNVLTRRPEPYHRKLKAAEQKAKNPHASSNESIKDVAGVKEKGLDQFLTYDWYRRASLLDHFLHPSTTEDSFRKCQYGEQGDFVLEPYAHEVREDRKAAEIVLHREGRVWVGDQHRLVRVEKRIGVAPSGSKDRAELRVSYRLSNPEDRPVLDLWFAPEFNFSFSVPEPDQDRPRDRAKSWERADRYLHWKLKAGFSEPSDFWVFPLETVSNSEGGFERTFQGVVFLPHWRLSLGAGESAERTLAFVLEKT